MKEDVEIENFPIFAVIDDAFVVGSAFNSIYDDYGNFDDKSSRVDNIVVENEEIDFKNRYVIEIEDEDIKYLVEREIDENYDYDNDYDDDYIDGDDADCMMPPTPMWEIFDSGYGWVEENVLFENAIVKIKLTNIDDIRIWLQENSYSENILIDYDADGIKIDSTVASVGTLNALIYVMTLQCIKNSNNKVSATQRFNIVPFEGTEFKIVYQDDSYGIHRHREVTSNFFYTE